MLSQIDPFSLLLVAVLRQEQPRFFRRTLTFKPQSVGKNVGLGLHLRDRRADEAGGERVDAERVAGEDRKLSHGDESSC